MSLNSIIIKDIQKSLVHSDTPPSLPQNDDKKQQEQRAFELSMARTNYNYMFSYMEPIPISAGLPKGEGLSLDYEAKVLKVFIPLLDNFKHVLMTLFEKEIASDLPTEALEAIKDVEDAFEQLQKDHDSNNPFKFVKEIKDLKDLLEALAKVPKPLSKGIKGVIHISKDLYRFASGLGEVFKEFEKDGFTAFLKNGMYDLLGADNDRNFLHPESIEEYKELFPALSLPEAICLEEQPWMIMQEGQEICEQDWYFCYMQIAGFNTTNLKAVSLNNKVSPDVLTLSELMQKMPVTDKIFQQSLGDSSLSLQQAAEKGLLFACDYSMFEGLDGSELHEEQRYPAAPIALFYWNSKPPKGYFPSGALQPVAIQLGQKHDHETTPIYTPNDCTANNDNNGVKWHIAKMTVQNACAIQHETVAHLGACHLTVEPIIIAANRRLSQTHPLMVLLKPHFRFTIEINNAAIHSLIVPGGVVASVLSTSITSSAKLIVDANAAWRFDEHCPDVLFERRGLGKDDLPQFPFREDTLELWEAIHTFVRNYLGVYYQGENISEKNIQVKKDYELQSWMNEMVNSKYASIKGMDGLVETGNPESPFEIDNFDYLCRVVSLIIYTASAQHASVNYAQFPLMSYLPSVSGTLYHSPPKKSDELNKDSVLKWLPPLDVSLYQLSFGYLLSGIQYDTLGYYTDNPRMPYFKDKRLKHYLVDFQMQLKLIEIEIHKRNQSRPMPYDLQLPSVVPNSISI